MAILLLQTGALASSEISAAFDIGTGKIKMQVARVSEGHFEPLYCKAEQISPSNEPIVDQEGMITWEGQERIVSVLKSLKAAGEEYGPTKCQAIATELFRTAKNGPEVAENISALLDVEIKIISPEEEGILSFLTIVEETGLDPEEIVVLDIGSGSFQITCKLEDQFLVYGAPYGRNPTYALVKNNEISVLKSALGGIDPRIIKKIQDCKNSVIGIGAHPKHILKSKTDYDEKDLDEALLANADVDIDHTDLLLVKTIMESLSISHIKYKYVRAGNTSGMFALSNPASSTHAVK
ncbi:MAG: hypothetical protein JSR39_02485 [Verrucomicrobia bacterium]|nr:hypothetical protein [Verrucomicrobiota bacterium]